MKKFSKSLISIILAILMCLPPVGAFAQTKPKTNSDGGVTVDLDDIIDGQDGKMDIKPDEDCLNMTMSELSNNKSIVYNAEDAKQDAGDNLSYVGTMKDTNLGLYKVNDTSNVHMVSDNVKLPTQAGDYLDAIANQQLMTTKEMSSFVHIGKGLSVARNSTIMEPNHTSLIKEINNSNSATDSILVLDENGIGIVVMDADGNRIKGATVTIRYRDDNGDVQTRATTTTEKGNAVFDKMKGVHFGALDVSHPNYRTKTSLNVQFEGGQGIERYMEPLQDDDLYVRCSDLDGLDISEFAGEIPVSGEDIYKQDMTFTILVTKHGNKTLPEKINLTAKNAGKTRVVKTFEKTKIDENLGDDTAAYICTANWVSDQFFKNGDVMGYELETASGRTSNGPGESEQTTGATIIDARSAPVWQNTKYSFLNGMATYQFDDDVPVLGDSVIGLDTFKFPVSVGMLPDGTVFISCGVTFSDKYNPESVVSAAWNPNKAELAKDFFKRAQNDVLSKIKQFQEGKDLFLYNEDRGSTMVDSSYRFTTNAIFSIFGHYDKDKGRVLAKLSAVFGISGAYGMTWYVFAPVAPGIVIPGYAGFMAGAEAKAAGFVTLSMKPSKNVGSVLSSITIDADQSQENGVSLDLVLSLAAYVGVGIHDLMCFQVDGNVYMDFGVDLGGAQPAVPDRSDPRFRITGGYETGLSATFMWIKWHKTLAHDRGWIYDSYGVYEDEGEEDKGTLKANNGTWTPIDVNASQSPLVQLPPANVKLSEGEQQPEQYKLRSANGGSIKDSNTKLIDGKTLNAGTPKVVFTDKYTILFRMIPVNGRVRLAYQYMLADGTLDETINLVPFSNEYGDQDVDNFEVVQYDAVADGEDYIEVTVIGDKKPDSTDVEEKAKASFVDVININLKKNTIGEIPIRAATSNGNKSFSSPVAIARNQVDRYAMQNIGGYMEYDYTTGKNTYCVGGFNNPRICAVEQEENKEYLYIQKDVGYNSNYLILSCEPWSVRPDSGRFTLTLHDNAGARDFERVFSYKQLTGKQWDGKSKIIQAYATIDNKLYMVIGNTLCYAFVYDNSITSIAPIRGVDMEFLDLPESPNSYEIKKGINDTVLVSSVVSEYDNDGNFAGTSLYTYRVVNCDLKDGEFPVIHGPQKTMLSDQPISNFAALPNSISGTCNLFFTKPLPEEKTANGVIDAAELYQWNQPPKVQVDVEAVVFTKNFIAATDDNIPLKVVCKNNGTNKMDYVRIVLYGDKTTYIGEKKIDVEMYPGDEVTLDMTDTKKPDYWTLGEHSVTARTDMEGNSSNSREYTVKFASADISMEAKKLFINGGERAYINIANASMVECKAPVIQVVGQFKKKSADDTNAERVVKTIQIPTDKLLESEFTENQNSKYNLSFSLEDIWNEYNNGKDVLYGVSVKLVPKAVANNIVTGEEAEKLMQNMPLPIFFDNPAMSRVVSISASSNSKTAGTVTGAGTYNIGDTVNLTAKANVGYKFIGWYDGDTLVSKNAALTFDALNNVSYKAKFESTKISITKCTILATNKTTIVKYGSKVLKKDTDYTVKTKNGKATITGIGMYSGTKTVTISTPKTVTLSKSAYTYNGKAKKPAVTVKDNLGKAIASKNYTVKYANNTKVGTATVTLTFKNDYKGTLKKTFKICPKNTSNLKLTAKSHGFKATWNKQSSQTTGYQIQYSTSSKFAKAKTSTVSKNTATSKAITNLTSKKKYYVRIRTYKTVSGKKYYSSWSAKKTVTTK